MDGTQGLGVDDALPQTRQRQGSTAEGQCHVPSLGTNIGVRRCTCLGGRLVQRHLSAKPIGNRLRIKTDETANPEVRNRALFHKAIDGHLARRKDLCELRRSQRVRRFLKLDC